MEFGSDGQRRRGRREEDSCGDAGENESRIEYAKAAIEEMATKAIRGRRSGTIGVEVAIKDGKLGKVKRLVVDFQPE